MTSKPVSVLIDNAIDLLTQAKTNAKWYGDLKERKNEDIEQQLAAAKFEIDKLKEEAKKPRVCDGCQGKVARAEAEYDVIYRKQVSIRKSIDSVYKMDDDEFLEDAVRAVCLKYAEMKKILDDHILRLDDHADEAVTRLIEEYRKDPLNANIAIMLAEVLAASWKDDPEAK